LGFPLGCGFAILGSSTSNISDTAHLIPGGNLQCDVLADGRRRSIGARRLALLLPKLGPLQALRNGVIHDALLQRPFASTRNLRIYYNIIICIKETVGENKGLGHTLTFFPSSFTVYSIVVRMPFSSTKSSFFGDSV
jgi:hypothetical protein